MKLKFVTYGISPVKLKDGTYELRPTTCTLGTFYPVTLESLKWYVKRFDRAWVEA